MDQHVADNFAILRELRGFHVLIRADEDIVVFEESVLTVSCCENHIVRNQRACASIVVHEARELDKISIRSTKYTLGDVTIGQSSQMLRRSAHQRQKQQDPQSVSGHLC